MEQLSLEFTGGIIHTNDNGEVIINNNATILVDKYGKVFKTYILYITFTISISNSFNVDKIPKKLR